jgi:nucleoside phosphorylase
MLIIFGALKIELNNIIQSARIKEKIRLNGVSIYSGILEDKDVIIVLTGMGKENAIKAVDILFTQKEIVKAGSINILITGFCGASRTGLKVGDLVAYKRVMDITRTGNIKENGQLQKPSFHVISDSIYTSLENKGIKLAICGCTGHVVSTPEEKRTIFLKYGVEVIDMESYWLIEELIKKEIPSGRISCLRAISDDSHGKLPQYFSRDNLGRAIIGFIKSSFVSIFSQKERRTNLLALKGIRMARRKLNIDLLDNFMELGR